MELITKKYDEGFVYKLYPFIKQEPEYEEDEEDE